MNTRQAYWCLVISILFEQAGTFCMTASRGFTRPLATLGVVVCYVITLFFFAQLLQHIHLSVAYATWTAAGTVAAGLIGFAAFGQQISPLGWLGIGIMCVGIFILNLFGTPKEEKKLQSDQKTPRKL